MSIEETLRGLESKAGAARATLDELAAAIKKSIAADPRDVRGHVQLGRVHMLAGRPAEAVRCFAQVTMLKPDHAEAFYLLGQAYHRLDQYLEEEMAYRSALRLKPDFADVHRAIAEQCLNEGRLDEGMKSLREAVRIEPSDLASWKSLWQVLIKLEQADEAKSVLARIEKLDAAEAKKLADLR